VNVIFAERREMLTAHRIFIIAKSQTKARGQCNVLRFRRTQPEKLRAMLPRRSAPGTGIAYFRSDFLEDGMEIHHKDANDSMSAKWP
jgi:hypothetical protein